MRNLSHGATRYPPLDHVTSSHFRQLIGKPVQPLVQAVALHRAGRLDVPLQIKLSLDLLSIQKYNKLDLFH